MASSKYAAHKASKEILLTIFNIGPTALGYLLDFLYEDKKHSGKRVIQRLEDNELISIKEVDGETTIYLSKSGKDIAIKYSIENMEIKRPKKWDGKWRLVAFDIPHEKKLARDILRDKLKDLDFIKIQKSIYLYPFECEDEIEFIRSVYEVRPFVSYIVAEKIENEEYLKKIFKL